VDGKVGFLVLCPRVRRKFGIRGRGVGTEISIRGTEAGKESLPRPVCRGALFEREWSACGRTRVYHDVLSVFGLVLWTFSDFLDAMAEMASQKSSESYAIGVADACGDLFHAFVGGLQ
jgi:hypothetical protein